MKQHDATGPLPSALPRLAALAILFFIGTAYTQVTWTPANSPTTSNLSTAAWNGSMLVAVGDSGTVITSADGMNWTLRASGVSEFLVSVAWTGSLFVAVGNNGALVTSPDGVNWTARNSRTAASLRAVAGSTNTIVAVGPGGNITRSQDGILWDTVPRGPWTSLYGVTWTGTRFVAVGNARLIVSSENGTDWILRMPAENVPGNLTSVCWTGTQAVAVGLAGIRTSPDGLSWTHVASSSNFTRVNWVDNHIVGSGSSTISTSTDGLDWTTYPVPDSTLSLNLVWAANKTVAVGNGGKIFVSANLTGVKTAPPKDNERFVIHADFRMLMAHFPSQYRGPAARATIHTLNGAKVADLRVPEVGTLSIPVRHLPRGVYLLEIRNGTARAAQRFTLSH